MGGLEDAKRTIIETIELPLRRVPAFVALLRACVGCAAVRCARGAAPVCGAAEEKETAATVQDGPSRPPPPEFEPLASLFERPRLKAPCSISQAPRPVRQGRPQALRGSPLRPPRHGQDAARESRRDGVRPALPRRERPRAHQHVHRREREEYSGGVRARQAGAAVRRLLRRAGLPRAGADGYPTDIRRISAVSPCAGRLLRVRVSSGEQRRV